jgi:hypothetical protein
LSFAELLTARQRAGLRKIARFLKSRLFFYFEGQPSGFPSTHLLE